MKKVTLLFEHRAYKYVLVSEGLVGYVLLVYGKDFSFDCCVCCYSQHHEQMAVAIKENRGELKRILICGHSSRYNAKLGVDATFDDFTPEGKEVVMNKMAELKEMILREISGKDDEADLAALAFFEEELRRKKFLDEQKAISERNRTMVRKLIAELRYEDARMHCEACGLNFEEFMTEARKHLTPAAKAS